MNASLKNLAGHMQVNKSNENYYLSDDTVIVADDMRSSVKSYDWRSSTSKTLLFNGWLRPQICTEEKVTYSANKLPCIDKGITNPSQKVTLHKLGISLTLLFKLPVITFVF